MKLSIPDSSKHSSSANRRPLPPRGGLWPRSQTNPNTAALSVGPGVRRGNGEWAVCAAVFAVWAEWNEGDPAQGWGANPYNATLRGPAASPADLLRDTPPQQLWLEWLGKLVTRWQQRPNILGWEPFSELDLITGASDGEAVDFVESAARVIRMVSAERPFSHTHLVQAVFEEPEITSYSILVAGCAIP